MRLHLHTDTATLSVSEVADMKRLDAVAHGDGDKAAALGAHGALDGEYMWIDIAWLRDAAGAGQDAAWPQGFDGMVAYAAGKGWTNPPGTQLRVHFSPA
jgi:hypothetical protein